MRVRPFSLSLATARPFATHRMRKTGGHATAHPPANLPTPYDPRQEKWVARQAGMLDDSQLLAVLCLVLKIGGFAHIDDLHLYGLRLLLGRTVILCTNFLGHSIDGILHLG